MNYMSAETEPSLLRNGKVGLKRDLQGGDKYFSGFVTKAHEVPIRDARPLGASLFREGFCLLDAVAPLKPEEFYEQQPVITTYYEVPRSRQPGEPSP